ncbi:hypothetical protein [Acinetobacter sp. CFCC 10889]|uniref:hypothetical protein n=1 Tax=Acinetobacter sp. CFCC 10889 TaxID=1775557 RepID=UPI000DCFE6DA|nr:hypothetical protein [Acinetobacter sp. CFCC 10889]
MKKIVLLACITALTACSKPTPEQNNSSTSTEQIISLQPSKNTLDSTRFMRSDEAGPLCPDNSSQCYTYAQEQIRAKYPDLIQKIGDGISIKLFNGTIKKYMPSRGKEDHPEYCEVCAYTIINEYPAIDSLLLHTQYYEGAGYTLLNLKTGTEAYLSGIPTFSPDYKYMLSINSDLEAGYTDNELNIYQIDDNHNAQLIFEAVKTIPQFHAENNIGFSAAIWLDNTKFIAQSDYLPDSENYSSEYPHKFYQFSLMNSDATPHWSVETLSEEAYQKLKDQ